MIKVHVHVIGYDRAAREVYEQALRGVGCIVHLMRGSAEFLGRFFFSGSKSAARSSYSSVNATHDLYNQYILYNFHTKLHTIYLGT